jgi:hypothetical protein
MTPPKCRICGMREHNHRCQGGTPAGQVAEQQRIKLGRVSSVTRSEAAAAVTLSSPGTPPQPPRSLERQIIDKANRRPWHDDTDSAGEPVEIADTRAKPARFYAPPGQCVFCDRRRHEAKLTMRSVRERGEA